MQNADIFRGWGGGLYQCEKYACMHMKFDFVRISHKMRNIGTKYMTNWNHFFAWCQEWVSILHRMK